MRAREERGSAGVLAYLDAPAKIARGGAHLNVSRRKNVFAETKIGVNLTALLVGEARAH